MYKIFLKPIIDKVLAGCLLLLFSPIILIVGVLLFLFQNGNVFFVQKRPGKGEKIFKVIKFRTMNNDTNENGELLSDSLRLTKVGKILRKTSLDELPQLWNVLIGEMSIIGPRPLLIEYLTLYNKEQARRHEVAPGITGWAQVNGRNVISWTERFKMDVWYVDNISFWVDLKILFLTLKNVIVAKNINQKGEATVQFFKGNNSN